MLLFAIILLILIKDVKSPFNMQTYICSHTCSSLLLIIIRSTFSPGCWQIYLNVFFCLLLYVYGLIEFYFYSFSSRDQIINKFSLPKKAQPGWRLFRSRAYYISSTTKTWQESRAYCRSVGADLIIINSREEQVFKHWIIFVDFANSFKLHMWIGLTDLETEGTWKWVDGSPLTTSYWYTNEPNGETGENCGEISNLSTEKSWNDVSCSDQRNWICEMEFTH
uniref:C-type lectin domain-containing protein n=1 Tax=Fundulus heteroclitus TaxID=8078 RepID=A0A3Q2QX32_FUNHE